MPGPATLDELELFAGYVDTRGRNRTRTVLAVGANPSDALWLRARGYDVNECADVSPDTPGHAFDGVWLGEAELDPERPEALSARFGVSFRVLNHGYVRVPIADDDPCLRWRLELLLERSHLRVVDAGRSLIAWTRLVSPLAGANGVVLDERGRVLLTERDDGAGWCLPGGASDPDETPRQTVVRELAEEVGLRVEPGLLIGVYSPVSKQLGRLVVSSFMVRVLAGTPMAGDEVRAVEWFDGDRLPEPFMQRHRIRIADALAVWRGEATSPFVRDE